MAPVPSRHSLSKFFLSLNISDFTFGDSVDWVYVETKALDTLIKRESLSEWGTKPFILEHKVKQEKLGTLFGQPTHSPAKGLTYTFNSALWVTDHFDVNVTIECDGISHTSVFTVEELNKMIAAAPSPKSKLWDYLSRLF